MASWGRKKHSKQEVPSMYLIKNVKTARTLGDKKSNSTLSLNFSEK